MRCRRAPPPRVPVVAATAAAAAAAAAACDAEEVVEEMLGIYEGAVVFVVLVLWLCETLLLLLVCASMYDTLPMLPYMEKAARSETRLPTLAPLPLL